MNTLYFGDNIEILRELRDEHVSLICTDPPFNSGRDDNTFLGDSGTEKQVFPDTWTWDTAAEDARAEIESLARTNATYKALDTCLKGYDMVLQNGVSGNEGAMRAYLAFIGPRLAEMHRVLTPTGSLYLHCDPTASHYLKGVMDTIFGTEHFRNEIVWGYKGPSRTQSWFPRKHDIILFYGKTTEAFFNPDGARVVSHRATHTEIKAEEGTATDHRKLVEDYWVDIPGSGHMSTHERLAYLTQKPRALYERMIKASSKEDDIVLDPFCGCGTTIDAAHTLNRQWIGIDITLLALDPMQLRLKDRHGLLPSVDYQIKGYPTNMQELQKLLKIGDTHRYHDFSNWAVTRLGLRPADRVEGRLDGGEQVMLWNLPEMKETDIRILAEVKTGKPTLTGVRHFCQAMNQYNADIGIFITLKPVSAKMRQEADKLGTFAHNQKTYPRLQFWQIDDAYFENPNSINTHVRLPETWRIRPTRKLTKHFDDRQIQFLRG